MLLSCTILTRLDYDSTNNVDIFVKLVHFFFPSTYMSNSLERVYYHITMKRRIQVV